MITAGVNRPGRENKGQPEASNKFLVLYSDVKTQATKIG